MLGVVLGTSGCSVAFMTPAPADAALARARPRVDCTSSNLAPIVDSVLASYEIAGVVYASAVDESRYDGYPISREADMAIGAAFAAAFVGSAVYGYVSAAHCRRVKDGARRDGGDTYLPGISAEPGP
jgi:hypothetical protein